MSVSQLAALDVRPLMTLYKALADKNRLRIVALLSSCELCVCHLEAALDAPQPTISRHLSILRSSRLVETRREGSWVYYRLAELEDAEAQTQLQSLVASYADRPKLRREVDRIRKSGGPNACC